MSGSTAGMSEEESDAPKLQHTPSPPRHETQDTRSSPPRELQLPTRRKRDREQPGLPPPPRRPPGPYMLYLQHYRTNFADRIAGLRASEVGKLAGAAWRELPHQEQEQYKRQSQQLHVQYAEDMRRYKMSSIDDQRDGEVGKMSTAVIKENNPKRPKGAFFYYLDNFKKERRVMHAHEALSASELSRLASRAWKALDSTSRLPYVEKSNAAKEEYKAWKIAQEQTRNVADLSKVETAPQAINNFPPPFSQPLAPPAASPFFGFAQSPAMPQFQDVYPSTSPDGWTFPSHKANTHHHQQQQQQILPQDLKTTTAATRPFDPVHTAGLGHVLPRAEVETEQNIQRQDSSFASRIQAQINEQLEALRQLQMMEGPMGPLPIPTTTISISSSIPSMSSSIPIHPLQLQLQLPPPLPIIGMTGGTGGTGGPRDTGLFSPHAFIQSLQSLQSLPAGVAHRGMPASQSAQPTTTTSTQVELRNQGVQVLQLPSTARTSGAESSRPPPSHQTREV